MTKWHDNWVESRKPFEGSKNKGKRRSAEFKRRMSERMKAVWDVYKKEQKRVQKK